MRFIQVSCLGASPSSESRMLRTKAAGEQSLLKEFPEVIIFFFSFSNAPGYDNCCFRTILTSKPAVNNIPFLSNAEFKRNFVSIHQQATIMRPATMIGTEDRILNRWAQFAKNWGFLPLVGGGSVK